MIRPAMLSNARALSRQRDKIRWLDRSDQIRCCKFQILASSCRQTASSRPIRSSLKEGSFRYCMQKLHYTTPQHDYICASP